MGFSDDGRVNKTSSRVSVVKGVNARDRTEKAIGLLGGMSSFISAGDVVFIKPNLVYPLPPPATTDVETIAAVVKLAKAAGASRVMVGDSPSSAGRRLWGMSSHQVFESVGLADVVRRAGGEIVALDEEEIVEISIRDAVICKRLKVYRAVADADKIISVPVMKTHFLTDVTLGLKCLYGIVAYEDRKRYHRNDLNQKLADISLRFRPALTVIDAGVCMEGFGLLSGIPVTMNLTIISSDVLAADAIGSAIMGFDPSFIDHLRISAMSGCGTIDLGSIDVVGEPWERCQYDFARPDLRLGGIWKNVTVIEGGVCRECRARVRWAINELESSALLDKISHLTLITGVTPFIPCIDDLRGLVVVIGDCAVYAASDLRRLVLKNRGIFIDGCPPDVAPRILPGLVRDTLSQDV